MQAKNIIGHPKGFSMGQISAFRTIWGQKSLGPLEKHHEMTDFLFCPILQTPVTQCNTHCLKKIKKDSLQDFGKELTLCLYSFSSLTTFCIFHCFQAFSFF
jgi:hypothetical protein